MAMRRRTRRAERNRELQYHAEDWAAMADEDPDDNWLHSRIITCPHCQHQLYRVDRSPFADDWQIYCDRCANRVEVSYYDPVVDAVRAAIAIQAEQSAAAALMAQLTAIEARLKPCSCGGRYRYDAPRRCHLCLGNVLIGEPDVDLWPGYFGIIEREPTPEEVELFEQFASKHIRSGDIWK